MKIEPFQVSETLVYITFFPKFEPASIFSLHCFVLYFFVFYHFLFYLLCGPEQKQSSMRRKIKKKLC